MATQDKLFDSHTRLLLQQAQFLNSISDEVVHELNMTTLCHNGMETEEKLVPSFEGIDPPLLDPVMVEHFNNLHSPEPETPPAVNTVTATAPASNAIPTAIPQRISLEDLIRMAAHICEADPSYSEQILSLLQCQTAVGQEKSEQNVVSPQRPPLQTPPSLSPTKTPKCSPTKMKQEERAQDQQVRQLSPVITHTTSLSPFHDGRGGGRDRSSEPSLPDTNTILSTLNQSILLQEYSHSLALQIATSTLQAEQQATPVTSSPPDGNLFVMENKASNFIPLKDFRRPGPKYTRKNFSPDQIEGLEAAFQEHRFVKKELRKQLASKLNLSERSISYWFQNKRARSKPPITMSSEAALKAARQQADQQASATATLQQTLQQSCAT